MPFLHRVLRKGAFMRYELNTDWEFAIVDSHAQNGSADPDDFKKLTFLPATVPGCAELDLFAAGC